jgi:membrane protein DedA with SNARE-associated domain/rhodanese-related sulfurtransferase
MQTLIQLIPTNCVALIALVAFLARLGAPIPAGPLLLIVGGLAGQPGVSIPAAFLASVVGSTLGDAAWFAAGRRYGYATLILLCKVSLTPDVCVSQNESIFSKWGGSSLVAAKFLPGISLVAPPMAGALGMTSTRFLLFEVAGGAIYSALFLALGYAFRAQVQAALAVISAFGGAAIGGLLLVLAVYACMRYRRRLLAARTGDVARVSVGELLSLRTTPPPPLLIDVRASVRQVLDGRAIPGSIHLAVDELRSGKCELDRGREIIVYCSCIDEATSVRACRVISKRGHSRVRALRGGLKSWMAAGLPVEVC